MRCGPLGLGLELRDLETRGHTDRVVALTEALGQRLAFPDLAGLRMGAYLHDLGKLAIPDAILLKPGALTDAERWIMQSHCDIGFSILENLGFLPQTARNIVRYHHERLDGSGYPFGLKGDEIPFEARLFAVVDVYDALVHARLTRLPGVIRRPCTSCVGRLARPLRPPLCRPLLS
jgi:uncharacterized domain HDIG